VVVTRKRCGVIIKAGIVGSMRVPVADERFDR
jgi:hypothetical protein